MGISVDCGVVWVVVKGESWWCRRWSSVSLMHRGIVQNLPYSPAWPPAPCRLHPVSSAL